MTSEATFAEPSSRAVPGAKFPPLESVTSPTVPTDAAAHYTNRQPNTLRIWACTDSGPIRPKRVHGRLAWSVSDIKSLMGVAA